MTPAPADGREYRAELIWAPEGGHGCSEQPGWTLYVDGAQIANTTADLLPESAQQWADAQLGEGTTWLPAAPSWYFVAHPRPCGGEGG
ncbi:MAG TPA: hypothetical protein VHH34_25760 [Pseudonocardiaceae bacterium]|nr:hypothetical protein [Pseudonocardiaceae bacterium]